MRICFAVIVVSWVCALPLAHAEIRFDDGQRHTITEEIVDEAIVVTNQTEVFHQGTIAKIESSDEPLIDVSDASKFIVDRGRIDGGDDTQLSEIIAREGSRFAVNGGDVRVSLLNVVSSNLEVTGGHLTTTFNGEFGPSGGLFVRNSNVIVSGGSITGRNNALGLGGRSVGMSVRASTVDMTGGRVIGQGPDLAEGLRLFSTSEMTISGGQVSASAGEDAIGLVLLGKAATTLSGGRIGSGGQYNSRGVYVSRDAQFQMLDGHVHAGGFFTSFALETDGTSEVRGGRISLNYGQDGRLFSVHRTANFAISGGEFEADGPMDASLTLFHVNDEASVTISGGSYSSTHAPSLGIHAEDQAEITIIGSDFNYPTFLPITETEGTITGTLFDGNTFSWTFQRDAATTILLIPEPSAFTMLIAGILCLAIRRRSPATFTASLLKTETYADLTRSVESFSRTKKFCHGAALALTRRHRHG